jgi:hypothetical protein
VIRDGLHCKIVVIPDRYDSFLLGGGGPFPPTTITTQFYLQTIVSTKTLFGIVKHCLARESFLKIHIIRGLILPRQIQRVNSWPSSTR